MIAFHFEIHTIMIMLALGNLMLLTVLVFYKDTHAPKLVYRLFLSSKLLQAAAWILLALGTVLPHLVSVYLANIFLVFGLVFECAAILAIKIQSRKPEALLVGIATACLLIFCIFGQRANVRSGIISLTSAALLLIASGFVLKVKTPSRLYPYFGYCYGFFALLLLFRAALSFFVHGQYELPSHGIFNVITLLPPYLALLIGGYGFLLFFRENGDNALRVSNDKLTVIFKSAPYAILLTELKTGTIVDANDSFGRLTGFFPAEARGKNTVELGIWLNGGDWESIIAIVNETGRAFQEEFQFRHRSGNIRTGLISSELIEVNGERMLLSSVNDISDRKKMEEGIQELLSEKELLLKEVHHRIKNNMSTVISLLSLQASGTENEYAATALSDAASRMHGMSLLYDKLYHAENYRNLSVKVFIGSIMAELQRVFPGNHFIKVNLEVDEFDLPPKILTPVGIIINELFTNSMKYAFLGRDYGEVSLLARIEGNCVTIIYRDDGRGFPLDRAGGNGFGLQLVENLAIQLDASMAVGSIYGVSYEFKFPVERES